MEAATVTNAFATGVKPVFKLTTQLGRSVKATANHKFLTMEGWRRLDELKPGDHIATPAADRLTPFAQNAPAGHGRYTLFAQRAPIEARDDVSWDQVASIRRDGTDEVFDLTVARLHNFVAGNVIAHNSIEQDADVVMFLFRPEYYKSDEKPGIAEVIVAKHRNGPTGTIELKFRRDHTRFYNLETRRPEPGAE
jgi:replicative DNA helicase